MGTSVKAPDVVPLPTLFTVPSVTQRFPSGPAAIPIGMPLAVGIAYSVNTPEVVTLATWLAMLSVDQRFPSGPAAIPKGKLLAVGIGCSDRKSTRLNSSHGYISYAVFCLKKKKKSILT